MASAKGTGRARAPKATDAATDLTTEGGASAPSSLAPGAAGEKPAVGADGGEAGGGDEVGGNGGDRVSGDAGAVGGSDGATGPGAPAIPGDGAAGDPGTADGAGGAPAPAGLPDRSDSGDMVDGKPLTEVELAAQAAGQALAAGGVGEALLELLQVDETAQTPPEEEAVAPVTSTAWELPEIGIFPARITVHNNTPSRVVVGKVRLEAHSKLEGLVDEDGYARIRKSLAAHARLGKWDNLLGVQVTHERKD